MTTGTSPTAGLLAAVDEVRAIDVDRLGEGEVQQALGEVQKAIRRLEAVRTRLAGTLGQRRRREAVERSGSQREGERAAREAQRQMADDLNLSPSQAKQIQADHRRLEFLPEARSAFDEGELSTDHVRVLDRTLRGLSPEDRARLEPRLVGAALEQDPVAFGRTCRAALAELSPEQAEADLDDQYRRRSGRIAQRPDGMTHFVVDTAGVDGAFLHTTMDYFRTRDAEGEHRTPEQRTADAFNELVRAAAGTIDDPNARHARPVFLIQLPAERLLGPGELRRLRRGVGTETFTGPLPLGELTRLLGDSHVAGLLADASGLPLAVTEQKRAVPLGLWRLLLARDGGCIREGCDAPPGWCEVAHLRLWQADGGLLCPDSAGLACIRHHRAFDAGQLAVSWVDGRPVMHTPGRPGERLGGRGAARASAALPASETTDAPVDHHADGSSTDPPEPPPTLPGIVAEPRATYDARAPGRPPGRRRPLDRFIRQTSGGRSHHRGRACYRGRAEVGAGVLRLDVVARRRGRGSAPAPMPPCVDRAS